MQVYTVQHIYLFTLGDIYKIIYKQLLTSFSASFQFHVKGKWRTFQFRSDIDVIGTKWR